MLRTQRCPPRQSQQAQTVGRESKSEFFAASSVLPRHLIRPRGKHDANNTADKRLPLLPIRGNEASKSSQHFDPSPLISARESRRHAALWSRRLWRTINALRLHRFRSEKSPARQPRSFAKLSLASRRRLLHDVVTEPVLHPNRRRRECEHEFTGELATNLLAAKEERRLDGSVVALAKYSYTRPVGAVGNQHCLCWIGKQVDRLRHDVVFGDQGDLTCLISRAKEVFPSTMMAIERLGQELVELLGEYRHLFLGVCDDDVIVIREKYCAVDGDSRALLRQRQAVPYARVHGF